MERVRRPLPVQATTEYMQIGIRSHGKGIFHKAAVTGAELGTKKVFEIREHDLILNIVFAWEGAVAVAGPDDDGRCGSHRFATYVARDTECDAHYLRLLFETELGRRILQVASPGSAGRNRTLNQQVLLDTLVPLPPLAEQRRIVDLVAAVDEVVEATLSATKTLRLALAASLSECARTDGPLIPLGDLVSMTSGPSWKAEQERREPDSGTIPVLKITNTRPDGRVVLDERAHVAALPTKTVRLDSSSIVMIRTNGNRARIGNVYRVPPEAEGHAVSAFQIAMKPHDPSSTDYLYCFLRSPSTQHAISDAASGTTGLGNIAVRWLKQVLVPWAPDEVRAEVVHRTNALSEVISESEREHAALADLRTALLGDLLSGKHEIPEFYDRLLRSA
ncbi:MAG: hypothetical protein WEA49_14100 [Acidimicrobiia bacterium]